MKYFIRIILLAIFASTMTATLGIATIHAADARNYRAGRIIDDAVFTNSDSMTIAQIQAFLDSKMPACDTNGDLLNNRGWMQATYGINPPYRCVNTFRENPDTGANNYGTAVDPAGSLSSAELIYKYAKQFNINPQVLIVTLQKENGMITDNFPIPRQFQQAMGFGCPDNIAPGQPACDPAYNSFSNQLYQAARHFRGYINRTPGWTITFNTGWHDIMWSPNQPTCGSGPVFIENQATAALYTYTPYQPNDAAKNAQYGGKVYCGAYGNRNFYLYFTDWFGPTTSNLVRPSGSDGVYLIENTTKRAIPSAVVFQSWNYRWTDVVQVSPTGLAAIPEGTPVPYNPNYREGRLVTSPTGGAYLVSSGAKRAFPNAETFASGGYRWSDTVAVSAYELSLIPDGTPMTYNVGYREGKLISSPTGGVYLVSSGTKRAFPSGIAFTSNSYSWSNTTPVSNTELSLIPDGTPMTYNVHYRDSKVITSDYSTIYLVDNGTKRVFASGTAFTSAGYKWSSIIKVGLDEINFIPNGLPVY